jgi:hypothetical protein
MPSEHCKIARKVKSKPPLSTELHGVGGRLLFCGVEQPTLIPSMTASCLPSLATKTMTMMK